MLILTGLCRLRLVIYLLSVFQVITGVVALLLDWYLDPLPGRVFQLVVDTDRHTIWLIVTRKLLRNVAHFLRLDFLVMLIA